MKCKLLIFGLMFLIAISIADAKCCLKSNSGEYCVEDTRNCDPSLTLPSSCDSSVAVECKIVCCKKKNTGEVLGTMTQKECDDSSKPGDSTTSKLGSCNDIDMDVGCCLTSYSSGIMQRAECINTHGQFFPEITNSIECTSKLASLGTEGCCIGNDGYCTYTNNNACDTTFIAGKKCNDEHNEEIKDKCWRCVGTKTECKEDKSKVFIVDGCNNELRSEDCVPSKFCDNIDYDDKGRPVHGCVRKDCIEDKEVFVNEYNFYTGESTEHKVKLTRQILGYKSKRTNGESWCIIGDREGGIYPYTDSGRTWQPAEESPGSRHYVYSCNKGRIVSTACGELRNSICKIKDGEAKCEENKWKRCDDCGDGFLNKCGEKECRKLGDCKAEGAIVKECFPIYPPGYYWWEEGADEGYCGSKHCGEGILNRCDAQECYRNGDCAYKAPSSSDVFMGCVAGAAIAEATWLTVGLGDAPTWWPTLFDPVKGPEMPLKGDLPIKGVNLAPESELTQPFGAPMERVG